MNTPTDEQLNIAMCEWMGWNHCKESGDKDDDSAYWYAPNSAIPEGWKERHPSAFQSHLPKYLSDDSPRRLLNEAEARLEGHQRTEYTTELRKIIMREMDTPERRDPDSRLPPDIYFYGATARQRVIALLKVVKPELFQ